MTKSRTRNVAGNLASSPFTGPRAWPWLASGLLLVFIVGTGVAAADDKHKGGGHRGKGHHGKHHHGGGHNFLGISPYGITYGYHDKNFGFEIGPLFGGGNYYHDHDVVVPYHEPYVIERPVYVEPRPYLPPAVSPAPLASQSDGRLIVTNERAARYQLDAERAFRQQRYEEALQLARHASVEDPENGMIFLFGSQAAFAAGQYQSAIQALDAATTSLSPKQWGYVVQNFRRLYRGDQYVKQMDRLVEYTRQNPQASYARTLRAYHYAYLGHEEAARLQLHQALEIEAQDRLARRLLAELGEALPAPPENERSAAGNLKGPN